MIDASAMVDGWPRERLSMTRGEVLVRPAYVLTDETELDYEALLGLMR